MDKKTDIKEKSIGKIILVTGGQRSGKSLFAEQLSLRLSSNPVYIATATIHDDEMKNRVGKHRERRGPQWRNLELPLKVSSADISKDDVVLLDCLTLLATNWFFELREDSEAALAKVKQELKSLFEKGATIITVTNEIGMGGVSPNKLQRLFTDLQGSVNQFVANLSNEAYLLVSGIPVKIK